MADPSPRRRPKLMARIFLAGLDVCGWFALRPAWSATANAIVRALGALTLLVRRGRRQPDVAAVASEWQRMMPSRKFVPITRVTEDTVYADILGTCPVTATGDLAACHRMMGYDRRLMERIGGEFVILESKADPAIEVCKIAIRLRGADVSDLVPAHVRGLKQG